MGQYYLLVNLDKKQYIIPHEMGDGLKLLEFGASGDGTMLALAVLLSDGNGRGGGDLDSKDELVGSWAGDRIVITGDYADKGKWGLSEQANLFHIAEHEFEDISKPMRRVLTDAGEELRKAW